MSCPIDGVRPPPPCEAPKIQLLLKSPGGCRWSLTVSQGMERFIGHYPRVPGLGSGGPLLRYERFRPVRSG